MSWQTLIIESNQHEAEALSDALLEHGALAVDLLDADADTPDEQAIFGEPGEAPPGVWQHNRISALFNLDVDVTTVLSSAVAQLGIQPFPSYQIQQLADNDWVCLTQSQFEPIPISERLWIVPTWHQPSDESAINIALDPGLAFGTGSHPTTRLCLRWLDQHIQGHETVLDYGCGSGILAIAALKLGAKAADGIDIDAQAVKASIDNAEANQVIGQFYLPEQAPTQRYDVVVANILTNPLRALAPLLADKVNVGGRIVLSGILEQQAEDIVAIYQQWFELAPVVFDEGWSCVSGVRKA